MEASYETKEPPIGSLDWWMRTITPEPTDQERQERARLLHLVFETWKQARNLGPVEEGMPANFVCGCLVDAAAGLMSVTPRYAIERMANWAESGNDTIDNYFTNAWHR